MLIPCNVVNSCANLARRHLSNRCTACASAFRAGKLFSPWNETQRTRILSLDSLEISADCGLCQLTRKIVYATHGFTDDVQVSIETTSKSDFHAQAVELEIKKGSHSNRYKLFLNEGIFCFSSSSQAQITYLKRPIDRQLRLQFGSAKEIVRRLVQSCQTLVTCLLMDRGLSPQPQGMFPRRGTPAYSMPRHWCSSW
jgi:hypothetical protein